MLNADDRHQIAQTLALLAYVTDEDQLDRLDELFVPDAVYDMSRSGMGVSRVWTPSGSPQPGSATAVTRRSPTS